MKQYLYPTEDEWKNIIKRPGNDDKGIYAVVEPILKAVKSSGDKALKDFSLEFDGIIPDSLKVSEKEFDNAEQQLSRELKDAIDIAYSNIFSFHISQEMPVKVVETSPGVKCWRKSVPIEKVGLYVPGGTSPLFSTVLMLGIPAKIANCKEIVLCTPPDKRGMIHPAILYTARRVGIKNVFKAGGAQAVAAMAYGTESIPAVYKIFGPGNAYVTVAKHLVQSEGVAIDMPAGPSEVLVIADTDANPKFIAADLLSQAEHGPDSQVIFVTDSEKLLKQVNREVQVLKSGLPRQEFIESSLNSSASILVESLDEAIDLSNEYAPEHLIIQTKNPETLAGKVINAGSVFLGAYSPEAVGDYASGTNHTLPTSAYAKAYSGVSLDSFMKQISYQSLTAEGLETLGSVVEVMAEAENLTAHKEAVSVRLRSLRSEL